MYINNICFDSIAQHYLFIHIIIIIILIKLHGNVKNNFRLRYTNTRVSAYGSYVTIMFKIMFFIFQGFIKYFLRVYNTPERANARARCTRQHCNIKPALELERNFWHVYKKDLEI